MKIIYLLPALLVFVLVSCNVHSYVSADNLRQTVEYLASDSCEGRRPFTAGADRACRFIAGKMKEYGLLPGAEDYCQQVPLVRIDTKVLSSMSVRGRCNMDLRYIEDFTAFNDHPGKTSIEAELVFAGYGIFAPEYGKNDFEGIENPEEKVAVVIVNDPGLNSGSTCFKGDTMTYYGRWTYKFEEGARQGLKGVLIIHDNLGAGYGWNTVTAGAVTKYALDSDEDRGLPLKGWISNSAARKLLSECGFNADSLFRAARESSFRPIELGSAVSVSMENKVTHNISRNIVGYVPGRTDECVVCTAHWDHLGVLAGCNGKDTVYNGATDNATAVAWLLETARVIKAAGIKPERNIVFVSTTAEESGLFGAEYYAAHPLFPMEKTVAVVNKDVLTLWGECNDVTITGFGYSDMDSLLGRIASRYGCHIMPDPEASNGMFYRSDHLPFMRRGVPAMFAKSWSESRAYGKDWSRARIVEYWSSVYHTVNDEVSPTDDYSGLVQETDIFLDFILELADGGFTPSWSASSEFKR